MSDDKAQDQIQAGGSDAKLFVGQVPAVCTEEMLRPLFAPYGTIVEIKVMRDGPQGRSKGCAWVRYEKRAEAEAAIEALHDQRTVPPQTNALQVRFAAPKAAGGGRGAAAGGNSSAAYAAQHGAAAAQQAAQAAFYGAAIQQFMMPYGVPAYPGAPGAGRGFPAVGAAPGFIPGYGMMPFAAPVMGYPGYAPAPVPGAATAATAAAATAAATAATSGAGQQAGGAAAAGPSVPTRTIFLGNLPLNTTADELRSLLQSRAASLAPADVRAPRPDKRFGFVSFADVKDATTALNALRGATCGGMAVSVQYAQDRVAPASASTGANGPRATAQPWSPQQQ